MKAIDPVQMAAMIGVVHFMDKQKTMPSQASHLLMVSAGRVLLPCHAFVVGCAASSACMESVAIGLVQGFIRVATGERQVVSLHRPYYCCIS